MGVPLPSPLNPGMSVSLLIDWTARLSTVPRRQGRRGQHYDFAQWYPRVAVYDREGWQVQPLMPQGEFYGEFATYNVTLDLPRNFVVGATGVPVSGDPGWEAARINKNATVEYARDAYGNQPVESLDLLERRTSDHHKRIRWRAEGVHHFAWTANPQYVYEGGRSGQTLIHALFLPSDTTWANVAVQRTARALQFMESVFGPYVWPQITNVHRVEGGGGTEFPMMIMDASASEGLIVHEIAHQWAHGILANNEFDDGWLDEGMASFLGMLYAEAQGQRLNLARALPQVAAADTAADARPIATPGAEFSDMGTYSTFTYTKPQLVFNMLRHMLGDSVFRAGMKRYYQDNKLEHVDEEDFKAAMEAVSGQDLDWFWRSWYHETWTLDQAVASVTTATGNTTIVIEDRGRVPMPVLLTITHGDGRTEQRTVPVDHWLAGNTSVTVTLDSGDVTRVEIDPERAFPDVDRSNNTWSR
jgi:hypothetical protein